MIWQRIGRARRGMLHASSVILVLTQVASAPAQAQTMANIGVLSPTAAVIAQHAAAEPAAKSGEPGALPPVSDAERQAYGCLVGGGTAAALTAIAGATETVMIVAGGILRPTNSLVLWVSLAGTVIASACAMSALATPGVVRLWNYYHDGARPAGK